MRTTDLSSDIVPGTVGERGVVFSLLGSVGVGIRVLGIKNEVFLESTPCFHTRFTRYNPFIAFK